jgi:hypothetical protein
MTPPDYFNRVADDAAKLWEQLKNPVLAGPWNQLFAQVQSPRHVLSELLQNADDAGAKSAGVRVVNNEFLFEHDGEDFTEEQFQSLCRFGYSNKRHLYTIGFRGVGFKSTFSLGNQVRIQTPTLDLIFERDRFTLPVWSKDATPLARTRISVPFADSRRLKQLRMNLEEWATSPVSLVFFRNLQELTVESHKVSKEILSRGPIPGSQRIRLTGATSQELILIRSAEEAFPEEVVSEIRQERNADDIHRPRCSVEIILGLVGHQRLFVVLPSGTEVVLPFSINAPFLQDPARQKIKEPEVSPCNRWLLERAGILAGTAMTTWLEKENLSVANRAGAYQLLRRPLIDAADLATSASKLAMDALLGILEEKPILLSSEEKLTDIGKCTALPATLHTVWDAKELAAIFLVKGNHVLSEAVNHEACQALAEHGWIETVSPDDVIQRLGEQGGLQPTIPKPASWSKLQILWEWVEQNRGYDWNGERRRNLRIVPAQGQSKLHPGKEIIRISSRAQNLSEDDWNFISRFALTIDKDWIDYLGKLKSKEARQHQALGLLQILALHEPSQVDRIAAQASRRLVERKNIIVDDCVRMAHIFAALNAVVPDDFHYVSQDFTIHLVSSKSLVFDANGDVEHLVPQAWSNDNVLHPDYIQKFSSCSEDRWFEWAYSAKSKLHAFIPITLQRDQLYGRPTLAKFLRDRAGDTPKEYRYKNDGFIIVDFNFSSELLSYWQSETPRNQKLWPSIVKGLLLDPLSEWENSLRAHVYQESVQGTTSVLDCGEIQPAWLIHLRSVPCVTDTMGNSRTPSELLLRTPETESLLGIEPFVAAELDDSAKKKKLLRLLGVRDTSTGWEKVVERLRSLTKAKDPMRIIGEVLRYYETLDRIFLRCSSDDQLKLRAVFANEALCLSNSLTWMPANLLCLHADPEDNAPVVHSAAQSMGLWLRIGVPERPALEKSLEWLKALAIGTRLDGGSYQHAKLALARGGRRVWEELGRWLSLDQTWEPVTELRYRVSMRNLTSWEKLSTATKRAAADLRMLQGEMAEDTPFTAVLPLAEVIELEVARFDLISGRSPKFPWLKPLAEGLTRVKLETEANTGRVREIARRLLNTSWQTVRHLEVIPCIAGTPAGEPIFPKVVWSHLDLYVSNEPIVSLYRALKEEIAHPFGDPSVIEAVAHCLDRDADFVRDYLAANLDLEPPLLESGELSLTETTAADKSRDEVGSEKATHQDLPGRTGIEPVQNTANPQDVLPSDGQNSDPVPTEPVKPTQPRQPTFMERYAQTREFLWHDGERCFVHANGAWISRSEAPFSWQEHAIDGSLARRLFVKETSLARGVEIPAELWHLMEITPDTITLVLCAAGGKPNEWSANDLKQLHAAGEIRLHQSQFILKESSP